MDASKPIIIWSLTLIVMVFFCGSALAQKASVQRLAPVALLEEASSWESSKHCSHYHSQVQTVNVEGVLTTSVLNQDTALMTPSVDAHRGFILRI